MKNNLGGPKPENEGKKEAGAGTAEIKRKEDDSKVNLKKKDIYEAKKPKK